MQEALGGLAGAESGLALSLGFGLGVVQEIMEAEIDEVVGPTGDQTPTVGRYATAAAAR